MRVVLAGSQWMDGIKKTVNKYMFISILRQIYDR